MVNPMVPDEYKNLERGDVSVGRHSIIGTGSTILPGVNIGEGVAVGAMSLINRNLEPWTINVGIPCRKIKERVRKPLEYEKDFFAKQLEQDK